MDYAVKQRQKPGHVHRSKADVSGHALMTTAEIEAELMKIRDRKGQLTFRVTRNGLRCNQLGLPLLNAHQADSWRARLYPRRRGPGNQPDKPEEVLRTVRIGDVPGQKKVETLRTPLYRGLTSVVCPYCKERNLYVFYVGHRGCSYCFKEMLVYAEGVW